MTRRDAGERYDPSVNGPVDVTKLLSALLRETPSFDDIAAVAARMDDRARDCRHLLKDPSFAADTSRLLAAVEDGATRIETLGRRVDVPFNARSVIDALQPVGHLARTLMVRLYSEPSSGPEYTASAHQSNSAALRELDQYRVRMLDRAVDDVIEFLGSDRARLAEGRPLVLTGAAGSGKTHLLCDAADGRIRDGAAAIVLLGQWFIDGEPFTQMLQKLDLRCSAAEFLDALDSAGEARGRKALLVIDALNESRPRDVWHRHLAGIAETVSGHAWIGFVVSCRSTYVAETLPEGGLMGAVAEEHQGFSGDVGNAVRRYFDHYGIARPRSPLVFPEFRNPLFLRLFCRAMQNAGLAEAPEGIDGASAVFDFFIGAVEKTLSGRDRLDYLPQHRHAANAISAIVDSMITRGDRRLPLLDAEAIAEAVKPSGGAYSKSLLSGLMHEGVLVNEIGSGGELVAFQYERLGDHLLARRLLRDFTEDNLRAGIATEPVSHFLSEDRRWRSSGVIEALAVQLPERFGIELHDVTETVVDDAFLASLVWRSRSAFSDSTLRRLEHLRSDNLRPGAVYDVLLMVAGVPGHRLNAEHLDAMLRPLSMIERDVTWTTYLNGGDDDSGPRRLISWAADIDEAQSYDRGALTLLTTALAWLLTASNRAVRDRSTKALVEVFTQRLDVANDTLRHFADVNDPYVVERVAAAACGAALRSADGSGVVVLAKAVFERFFVSQDRLPVHLLTRDYLRLIVERAHFLGEAFPMDRVRPPYGSTLTDPPRLDELEPFAGGERGDPDANQGLRRAWYSVMHGDFALYVIGTNAGMFHWLPKPGTPEKRRPADIIESFQQRLNPRQRDAWHIFQTVDALNGFDVSLIADDGRDDPDVDVGHIDIDDADALERLRRQTLRLIVAPMLAKLPARLRANPPSRDGALASLRETLDDQVRADFDTNVLPALADASIGREPDERFDLGLVQRFVFDYVIKTGYDRRLGAYDDVVDRDYDRAARILERIGKKYQWQGLHEYLARIADNCPFKDDAFPSRVVPYEGAWQTSFRDIDPTFIPQHDDKQPGENAAHWNRV
ncbi:MAG: hypothetical protein M3N13_01510, partial [Candidatus Eremiobacteraeota bacterium]|nr:hypothetical protein [Candidatus Eremiobacteraeota bacterium]